MGFTNVKVKIYSPANLTKAEEIELLVDSGALFTTVPRSLLKELRLEPFSQRKLRAFGGAVVDRDIGVAVIEYEQARAGVPVIFGEREDIPILGITALESLGYQLDPITKKLKPVELLMV